MVKNTTGCLERMSITESNIWRFDFPVPWAAVSRNCLFWSFLSRKIKCSQVMSMGKVSPTALEFGHDFLAENGPKNHNQNMVLWGIDMTWELLIPLLA